MEYSLFTIVDDEEAAQRMLDLLKEADIDAYYEEMTDYEGQPVEKQWSVFIDESKADKAQPLLEQNDLFFKKIFDFVKDIGDSPKNEQNFGNDQRQAADGERLYSASSGSSFFNWERIIFILLGILIIGGYKACKRMQHYSYGYVQTAVPSSNVFRHQRAQEAIENRRRNDSIIEKNAKPLTFQCVKDDVMELYGKPIVAFSYGTYKVDKVTTKGKDVLFDLREITVSGPSERTPDSKSSYLSRKLPKWIYERLRGNRSVYGKQYFKKMTDLGVTFQFRIYEEGASSPFTNIKVTAEDVKSLDHDIFL